MFFLPLWPLFFYAMRPFGKSVRTNKHEVHERHEYARKESSLPVTVAIPSG